MPHVLQRAAVIEVWWAEAKTYNWKLRNIQGDWDHNKLSWQGSMPWLSWQQLVFSGPLGWDISVTEPEPVISTLPSCHITPHLPTPRTTMSRLPWAPPLWLKPSLCTGTLQQGFSKYRLGPKLGCKIFSGLPYHKEIWTINQNNCVCS